MKGVPLPVASLLLLGLLCSLASGAPQYGSRPTTPRDSYSKPHSGYDYSPPKNDYLPPARADYGPPKSDYGAPGYGSAKPTPGYGSSDKQQGYTSSDDTFNDFGNIGGSSTRRPGSGGNNNGAGGLFGPNLDDFGSSTRRPGSGGNNNGAGGLFGPNNGAGANSGGLFGPNNGLGSNNGLRGGPGSSSGLRGAPGSNSGLRGGPGSNNGGLFGPNNGLGSDNGLGPNNGLRGSNNNGQGSGNGGLFGPNNGNRGNSPFSNDPSGSNGPNGPGGSGGSGGSDGDPNSEPANYEFSYEVDDPPTGQSFGHSEKRQGDNTRGSYFVELPDGRLQRVSYTAGVDGYRAQVSYEPAGGFKRSGRSASPAPAPTAAAVPEASQPVAVLATPAAPIATISPDRLNAVYSEFGSRAPGLRTRRQPVTWRRPRRLASRSPCSEL